MRKCRWPTDKGRHASLFFTLVPIVDLILIYMMNGVARLFFMGIGMLLVTWFVVFLGTYRRKELGSMMVITPSIVGPGIAAIYVKLNVPHLHNIQINGGDVLVQISFFWAALFGLIIYIFQRIATPDKSSIKDLWSFSVLIIILVIMLMSGELFMTKIFLPGDGILPDVTLLFVFRVVLVLYAVSMAAWPSTDAKSTQLYMREQGND